MLFSKSTCQLYTLDRIFLVSDGAYFKHIVKDINCNKLFISPLLVNGKWSANGEEHTYRR